MIKTEIHVDISVFIGYNKHNKTSHSKAQVLHSLLCCVSVVVYISYRQYCTTKPHKNQELNEIGGGFFGNDKTLAPCGIVGTPHEVVKGHVKVIG